MNLEELQKIVFGVIQQPLTASEEMRKRTPDGKSVKKIVESVIKPNDRLTSFERLEIYNRVYWFRLLSAIAEDFPGLCAILGQKTFYKAMEAYLTECPSESFTLRNLGSRLEGWLERNPQYAGKKQRLALDMVRLEWADIEVFDSAELPRMTEEDLQRLGEDPVFHLQPYLRLLELDYPVDDMLLKVHEQEEQESDVASNVVLEREIHAPAKRIRAPRPKKTYLAVHRQENSNYFKNMEQDSFALLRALHAGKPLSAAIEESVSWSNQSVEHVTGQIHEWFSNWSSLGWFCK